MRILLLCILLLFVYGCAQNQEPKSGSTAYLEHERGQFTFAYPDWTTVPLQDQMFLAKNNGTCVFAASEYPVAAPFLKTYLEDELNTTFNGEYGTLTMDIENNTFDAKLRLMYCDYKTYTLTLACLDKLPEMDLLKNASCARRELNTKEKLGLIPFPPNENMNALTDTLKQARTDGADVLYWYFSWQDLDGNWTAADWIMTPMSYEGKSAVVMEVVHTTVLGKYPSKYASFDEPGFKEDFAKFSADFAKRYKPDYYFVGNEADIYLASNRDKISAYKAVLEETRTAVKKESPGTKVGVVVTYHAAKQNGAFDIIEELSEEADLIGYTSYGHGPSFAFDNVSKGKEYLGELENVVPGKPFAVTEAGWSSSTFLNSSEDLQDEYARYFFEYLERTDAEFVNWFDYHDGVNCQDVAESFLIDKPEIVKDERYMKPFREFICTLGIKESDGTPKKAWDTWQENT